MSLFCYPLMSHDLPYRPQNTMPFWKYRLENFNGLLAIFLNSVTPWSSRALRKVSSSPLLPAPLRGALRSHSRRGRSWTRRERVGWVCVWGVRVCVRSVCGGVCEGGVRVCVCEECVWGWGECVWGWGECVCVCEECVRVGGWGVRVCGWVCVCEECGVWVRSEGVCVCVCILFLFLLDPWPTLFTILVLWQCAD